MIKISIHPKHPALLPVAKSLAEKLNLPLSQNDTESADYILSITENYIGLQQPNTNTKPFYIDFLSKKLTYRRQHATLRNETLSHALGLKKNSNLKIIDATAGLARDSFILATLGFEITLLERSPLITILLNDAMKRASKDPTISPIIQRMDLIETDAITWMQHQTNTTRPDIIYLDPMFPERDKSALSKKDMRIFHDIVGADTDSIRLLPAALTCATKRVVVKRPRLAENLAGITPSFSQEGSSSRFDVYLI